MKLASGQGDIHDTLLKNREIIFEKVNDDIVHIKNDVPKGKPAEPISPAPVLGSRPAQVHGDNHPTRRNTVNPRAMATYFNCPEAGNFIKDCPRRQRMAAIMTDQHETHVETVPL
ncbi:hypothetical protein ACOMHN_053297 [Nucella lapillus]